MDLPGAAQPVFRFCALTNQCGDSSAVYAEGWDFTIRHAQKRSQILFGDEFPVTLHSDIRGVPCLNKTAGYDFHARHEGWQKFVDEGCQAALIDMGQRQHLQEAIWLEKKGLIVFLFSSARYFSHPPEEHGEEKESEGKPWKTVWNGHYAGHLSYHAVEAAQSMGAKSICILYNKESPWGHLMAETASDTWRRYVGDALILSYTGGKHFRDPPLWAEVFTTDCITSDFLYVFLGNAYGGQELCKHWSVDLLLFLCKSSKVYDLVIFYGALSGAYMGLGDETANMVASYVFDEKMWHWTMQREGDYFVFKSNQEFVSAFVAEFSRIPWNEDAIGANAAIIAMAAIQRAQSVETEAVNNAIEKLSHNLHTFMGPVVWHKNNLLGRELLLVQLQPLADGVRSMLVAPEKYSRAKAIIPAPVWEERQQDVRTLCHQIEFDWVLPVIVLTVASLMLFLCLFCTWRFCRRLRHRRNLRLKKQMVGKVEDIELVAAQMSAKASVRPLAKARSQGPGSPRPQSPSSRALAALESIEASKKGRKHKKRGGSRERDEHRYRFHDSARGTHGSSSRETSSHASSSRSPSRRKQMQKVGDLGDVQEEDRGQASRESASVSV